jgi:hypothetical protein
MESPSLAVLRNCPKKTEEIFHTPTDPRCILTLFPCPLYLPLYFSWFDSLEDFLLIRREIGLCGI